MAELLVVVYVKASNKSWRKGNQEMSGQGFEPNRERTTSKITNNTITK